MSIASKDYLKRAKPATVGGWEWVSLKSIVFRQDHCEYWPPNYSSCRDTDDGQILNQLSGVDLHGTFTQNVKK